MTAKLIAVVGAVAWMPFSTAYADRAYFDIALEDGTQVGEIRALQEGSGSIEGGARFRDELGDEPYADAPASIYEMTAQPDGYTVVFRLSQNGKAIGKCPMLGDAKPLLLSKEKRLLGTCILPSLNDGKMFGVVMTPHAGP